MTLNSHFNNHGLLAIDGSGLGSHTSSFTVDASATSNAIDVIAADGTNILTGGSGNDTFEFTNLLFHGIAPTVAGGAGTDTLSITDGGTVSDSDFAHVSGIETLAVGATAAIDLGANATAAGITSVDATALGAGSTLTLSGSANEGITLSAGNLAASTATGNLHVTASGTGAHTLSTGSGNDVITGGAGADVINAGAGNNTIDGGAGADALSGHFAAGGGGSNTFEFTSAVNSLASAFDMITEFGSGFDKLQIGYAPSALDQIASAGTGSLATDLGSALTAAVFNANDVAAVTISSGTDAGTYVVINNGHAAGYNPTGDAVVQLLGTHQTITQTDFIA